MPNILGLTVAATPNTFSDAVGLSREFVISTTYSRQEVEAQWVRGIADGAAGQEGIWNNLRKRPAASPAQARYRWNKKASWNESGNESGNRARLSPVGQLRWVNPGAAASRKMYDYLAWQRCAAWLGVCANEFEDLPTITRNA